MEDGTVVVPRELAGRGSRHGHSRSLGLGEIRGLPGAVPRTLT
jgi:hypothetical protein